MELLQLFMLIPPFIVASFIAQYKRELIQLLRAHVASHDDTRDIVLLVLSARENHDKRRVIRETWGSELQSNGTLSSRISLKFVVGAERCQIPVTYRENPYSCSAWNMTFHPFKSDSTVEFFAFSVVEPAVFDNQPNPNPNQQTGVFQLSFKVRHSIVITKLGLLSLRNHLVNIHLIEATTQADVVSVTMDIAEGRIVNGYRYKTIEPYVLPSGFEGKITTNIEGTFALKSAVKENNAGGVVHFYPNDDIYTHYASASIPLPLCSFMYRLHDTEKFLSHIAYGDQHYNEWQEAGVKEEDRLQQEIETYNDLLTLPSLVDVYRNIPLKLLSALKWASQRTNVAYVAKVDDDCYLNLHHLLSALSSSPSQDSIWMGRFRHNWVVEREGKWAERDYTSLTYPPFACGALYALTSPLVSWLATNSRWLNLYQGEDTSMGIWLAAVDKLSRDLPSVLCENKCVHDMIASPDWSPDELLSLWQNYKRCGNPCVCS